jgi:capsid protein
MSAFLPPPEIAEPLLEAWGDPVDTREFLRDDPSFGIVGGRQFVYATSIDDRRDGRFRPVYETEQDLAILRAAARNLVIVTGVRTAALDALANYTFGQGFTFEAMPEDDTMRQSLVLAKMIQDVIDRFLDENDFCGKLDREVDRRAREDGDALIAFDDDEIRNGRVLVEFVEPDQLTEPRDARDLEEWLDCCDMASCWKFGVHTPANKTWKPLGYHIVRDGVGRDWDYYPANRIEHVKRNVTANAKRGVSDFLETLSDLQREAKLCGNMVQGASLQAAIAWILQGAPGQTQSQLQGVGGAERTTFNRPATFPTNGTTTRNAAQYPAGSILKVGAGQEYLAGPMGAERNAGFELVGQYALRRIGVRWNMPEYMISGDASNANFSSTLVAGSPFSEARKADQQFYKRHFLSLLWKAIRIHVESGRFVKAGIGRDQFDDVLKLVRIDCECPTVDVRDPKNAVDSDKVMVDGGIMSERTWAARNGLDFDKEQRLGALKAPPQTVVSPFGHPGLAPPPPPGAAKPPSDAQPNADTTQSAVQSALESIESTEEARSVLKQLQDVYP